MILSSPLSADALVAGPRGRRFLLEYALASELAHDPVRSEQTFGHAAMQARIDDSRSVVLAAERLAHLDISEPTSRLLRISLAATTGHARYWEGPDELDSLAAAPDMVPAQHRVAERLAGSRFTEWWLGSVLTREQHSVQWADATATSLPRSSIPLPGEQHSYKSAGWGAEWSSRPGHATFTSTGLLPEDDGPAGLWFAEDQLGWDRARTARLAIPESTNVFEIAGPDDWAELCIRFPLDVTAEKQEDWRRATSREGDWVIPDWSLVAEHYDGVHLQLGAYLAVAGLPILVDNSASMVAGWNPDETHWFSEQVTPEGHYTYWHLEDDGADMVWTRRAAP